MSIRTDEDVRNLKSRVAEIEEKLERLTRMQQLKDVSAPPPVKVDKPWKLGNSQR